MKILFTADIHIKLGQKSVPVPWALNRFDMLFEQIAIYSKDCDMLIIGGDIFDRVPTMQEIEVYYNLVVSCRIPTLIYPGNHEAHRRNTTFLTFLKGITSRMNPLVTIIDDVYTHPSGEFDIVPYNKLREFNPKLLQSKTLFTHVRGEIPPHVKPEVDLDIFTQWEVVLAGDLHSYENSQRNILYPGSPITTSFHRHAVQTGVIVYDTETCKHEWLELQLPQLIRKTVDAGEPTPSTDFDHTVYEMQGDLSELAKMDNSELIERKVVRRSSDTSLLLTNEMSIQEEVSEYLLYILTLDQTTVENVLKELMNHVEKFE